MKSPKLTLMRLLWVVFAFLMAGCAATVTYSGEPKDIPILQKWSSDYPVAHLNRLPQGQQKSRIRYIGDTAIFATVWQAFMPELNVSRVDFSTQLIVFSRNVDFYNRTSNFKIKFRDGVVEVLAVETISATPIENKVGMALVLIPREGVKFIQAGSERISVAADESAVDPLNTTYTIERYEVRLVNGRHEVQAAPGSATKIRTWLFDEPVWGDLNGDGTEDAALLLVHVPGGSGTFYYVAVALNTNGAYRGTNGILIGDRIAPQNVSIRNGVVIANYADRRLEDSMTVPPSVGKSKCLALKEGRLEEIEPLFINNK